MWDLGNNIKRVRSVSPVAVGTTGTGQAGVVVDRQGYEAVGFELDCGAVTATNATIVAVCKEGDTTGAMTSIADSDLIGTESDIGVPAEATARTSGVGKNVSKGPIGYKGIKRYVSVSVYSTVTAAPPVSTTVLLGKPRHAPVS